MYYGYAFESYCSSDQQDGRKQDGNPAQLHPPGWGGDVDTNVQWCSVVKTKLADFRLLIGGEVDCVRGSAFLIMSEGVLSFILQDDLMVRRTASSS